MLNRSKGLAMSTSVLKALPGKLDIKRHSTSILYVWETRGLYLLVHESIVIALFIYIFVCITLFKTINCFTLSLAVGIAFSFQLVFGYS